MEKVERDKRWASGKKYNNYITNEINSFRKNAWKKQISKNLGDSSLKILDIGTGPGFFACILTEEGHNVTGIDSSLDMLSYAKNNAKKLNVSPTFLEMDVNKLDFEDESFDVVISRNVTWTLENPEKVYEEFKRVVKPNGKIIIYDANWILHFYDKDLMEKVKKHEKAYYDKYGEEEIIATDDMEYYETAPLTKKIRPAWDVKKLSQMGMSVKVTNDVGRFVYEDWEKELYQESPLFEIVAKKNEEDVTKNMHTYWQERSNTFGFDIEESKKVMQKIAPYVKCDVKKVLDVGTGTGVIAAATSMLGLDVTACDLCENMLKKAEENLKENGLKAKFTIANADKLPFNDNSFDMLVNRNLLWALKNPEKAIKEFSRVLKPGGILFYIDGNHYNYLFFEEAKKAREKLISLVGSIHGCEKDKKFDSKLCDETAYELPLSKIKRPYDWDNKVLEECGFKIFKEEIEIPQNLLDFNIGKGFYEVFTIVAKNTKKES